MGTLLSKTELPDRFMSLSTTEDPRLSQLKQWLGTVSSPATDPESIRPASSDASFRRYFRVDGTGDAAGATYIVLDAPPPQEDVRPFIHVAEVFGDTGVSVPHILARDEANGFLLLSDLGSTTYLHRLNNDSAKKNCSRNGISASIWA